MFRHTSPHCSRDNYFPSSGIPWLAQFAHAKCPLCLVPFVTAIYLSIFLHRCQLQACRHVIDLQLLSVNTTIVSRVSIAPPHGHSHQYFLCDVAFMALPHVLHGCYLVLRYWPARPAFGPRHWIFAALGTLLSAFVKITGCGILDIFLADPNSVLHYHHDIVNIVD